MVVRKSLSYNIAMKNRKRFGFTIVELLIVIVIIAILAAITVVAYNEIQQRARNATRVSAIQTYIKLLSVYAIQNNTYPSFTNGACLGTGYTGSSCTNSTLSQTVPSGATEQSTFNSGLSAFGNIPDYPKLESTGSKGGNESGAFIYNYGATNETPARTYRIVYFLEGMNQNCQQARIVRNTDGSAAGTGAWQVTINGYINSGNTTGGTRCILSLLNPTEF